MWTYTYINKNYLQDCVMQTLVVYLDDSEYTREIIKSLTDDETFWSNFAESYIEFLQSMIQPI
jgi:hypothetical protein